MMTRKKKSTDEVKEVAQEIASVVIAERPKVDVPKAKEVEEKPKIKEVKVAKTSPTKNVRIKATTSMRGQFNNLKYEIKSGEVYTFPESLANWLIELGRAI
jgi:hypothetical protein